MFGIGKAVKPWCATHEMDVLEKALNNDEVAVEVTPCETSSGWATCVSQDGGTPSYLSKCEVTFKYGSTTMKVLLYLRYGGGLEDRYNRNVLGGMLRIDRPGLSRTFHNVWESDFTRVDLEFIFDVARRYREDPKGVYI